MELYDVFRQLVGDRTQCKKSTKRFKYFFRLFLWWLYDIILFTSAEIHSTPANLILGSSVCGHQAIAVANQCIASHYFAICVSHSSCLLFYLFISLLRKNDWNRNATSDNHWQYWTRRRTESGGYQLFVAATSHSELWSLDSPKNLCVSIREICKLVGCWRVCEMEKAVANNSIQWPEQSLCIRLIRDI